MDSVIWLSKHVYAYLFYVSYYNTNVPLQQYIQNTEMLTLTKNTETWNDDKNYGDFEGFWKVKTFLT